MRWKTSPPVEERIRFACTFDTVLREVAHDLKMNRLQNRIQALSGLGCDWISTSSPCHTPTCTNVVVLLCACFDISAASSSRVRFMFMMFGLISRYDWRREYFRLRRSRKPFQFNSFFYALLTLLWILNQTSVCFLEVTSVSCDSASSQGISSVQCRIPRGFGHTFAMARGHTIVLPRLKFLMHSFWRSPRDILRLSSLPLGLIQCCLTSWSGDWPQEEGIAFCKSFLGDNVSGLSLDFWTAESFRFHFCKLNQQVAPSGLYVGFKKIGMILHEMSIFWYDKNFLLKDVGGSRSSKEKLAICIWITCGFDFRET